MLAHRLHRSPSVIILHPTRRPHLHPRPTPPPGSHQEPSMSRREHPPVGRPRSPHTLLTPPPLDSVLVQLNSCARSSAVDQHAVACWPHAHSHALCKPSSFVSHRPNCGRPRLCWEGGTGVDDGVYRAERPSLLPLPRREHPLSPRSASLWLPSHPSSLCPRVSLLPQLSVCVCYSASAVSASVNATSATSALAVAAGAASLVGAEMDSGAVDLAP